MTDPLVSILMVARNTAPFVDQALRSAREQTVRALEVVFVDDGSTDGTAQIAQRHADEDPRVRVLAGPQEGLSAVRNASLRAARAPLALVLDSDDMLHPRHCEVLMEDWRRHKAHVAGTNMLEFEVSGSQLETRPFARGPEWGAPRIISAAEYLRRGMVGGAGELSLGYLKPLFDMAFLRRHSLVYDQRLRIGEDIDLVIRALLAGGQMRYLPQCTYHYRRHTASTSHRVTEADLQALLSATDGYRVLAADTVASVLAARRDNLQSALAHLDVISALKQRDYAGALRVVMRDPAARAMTVASITEALLKRIGRQPASRRAGRESLLDRASLSRQLCARSNVDSAVARGAGSDCPQPGNLRLSGTSR